MKAIIHRSTLGKSHGSPATGYESNHVDPEGAGPNVLATRASVREAKKLLGSGNVRGAQQSMDAAAKRMRDHQKETGFRHAAHSHIESAVSQLSGGRHIDAMSQMRTAIHKLG